MRERFHIPDGFEWVDCGPRQLQFRHLETGIVSIIIDARRAEQRHVDDMVARRLAGVTPGDWPWGKLFK